MVYRVTVILKWEAGHRLSKHAGGCKHLHGHSYRAEISLESNTLNTDDMVMDFSFIKKPIRDWINENWDHAFLLNDRDEFFHFLNQLDGDALYLFDNKDPTAEVIAQELLMQAQKVIRTLQDSTNEEIMPTITKVKVWETETAFAEVRYVA